MSSPLAQTQSSPCWRLSGDGSVVTGKFSEKECQSKEFINLITIGGAGKFLRVRRIFARILPNLPEKNSKK